MGRGRGVMPWSHDYSQSGDNRVDPAINVKCRDSARREWKERDLRRGKSLEIVGPD